MQTNVFLGGSDPVLGSNPYNPNISEIEANIQRLQQAQQQMEIQKQRMLNPSAQQVQSRNPVWDEIDKLVSEMSDSEFEMVNNNPEYQQSYQKVMAILNREYMRVMRPLVEESKDGKAALEELLGMAKKIKKSASEEVNKNMALFAEYTAKYAECHTPTSDLCLSFVHHTCCLILYFVAMIYLFVTILLLIHNPLGAILLDRA
jgi:hypothetical protein